MMAGSETETDGRSFWESSTDTHKADESYYQRVAVALQELVVPLLAPHHRLMDFGCGNGEFTRALGAHCASALGIDVSLPLIDAATETVDRTTNIRFEVGSQPPEGERFDVVACMGVLVCVLGNTTFTLLVRSLARAVNPGGHLILRETFGWGDPQLVELDDYVAHYRSPLDYLRPLAEEGIELLHDEHLVTWSEQEQRSNHLWILHRPI